MMGSIQSEEKRGKSSISSYTDATVLVIQCTDKNVLFDSLRQRSTSFFHRDFGGLGYGGSNVDKMLVMNVKYTESSLGFHRRGVWGSEENINIHIITKTGSGSITWIQFSCCDERNKNTY